MSDGTATSSMGSVAVAIPAFNEASGIGEFLVEIDRALSPHVSKLTLVVVDDASTDDTVGVAKSIEPELRGNLDLHRMAVNAGHGPTLLEAYRRALDTGAEFVIAVDGDGQFLGSDLRRVLVLLRDGGDGVCGVRRFRYDPWFRMLMTRVLRVYIQVVFGVPTRDANCPLRGYRADFLDDLLGWLPADALVPNLELTILAARRGATLVEVDVNHRVRRGAVPTGTMFASARRFGVLKRLLQFSLRAFGESNRFHRDVNRGRRPVATARR